MKIVTRIILTFLSFVASYSIFIFSFSFIPRAHNIPAIPIIVSISIAVIVGFIVWKQTGAISNVLLKYIIMGGLIIGSIGFILGFIGPIIFSPSANLGPLLGIFITGPIGFLIGLVGGRIYWFLKVKNKKNE